MQGKITLITPPDIWENENLSILLIDLNENDQVSCSEFLKTCEFKENLNIYFYSGEENTIWFLYALARADYIFCNIDNSSFISRLLLGYILAKNNVYYQTENNNISAVLSHINQNRTTKIELFLEEILKKATKDEK